MNQHLQSFLDTLRQASLLEKVPIISPKNAQFLHWLCRSRNAKNVLELGTADGYSTIWLADGVQPNNGTITTIEHSAWHFERAQKNFATTNTTSIIDSRFGDASKILPELPVNFFDLIFIDARKNKYADFLKLSIPLLTDDGCVVADDVIKFRHKMPEFYAAVEQHPILEHTLIPIDDDDGIMLLWKKICANSPS